MAYPSNILISSEFPSVFPKEETYERKRLT